MLDHTLLGKDFARITSVLKFSSTITPLPLFVGVDKTNIDVDCDGFFTILELIFDSKVLTRSAKDNFLEMSVCVLKFSFFCCKDPPSLFKVNFPSEAVWILKLVLHLTFPDLGLAWHKHSAAFFSHTWHHTTLSTSTDFTPHFITSFRF